MRYVPSSDHTSASSSLFAFPYDIDGETFVVELEEGLVLIRHDKWSLIGCGETLLDAETNLLAEARELLDVLIEPSPIPLDSESRRMLDFLFRVA